MDKITVDMAFPSDTLSSRMGGLAEYLATACDHHECGDCVHKPTLHIRINDQISGKGIDYFYTHFCHHHHKED